MLVGTTRGANEIHTKSGVVDVLITRDNNELISDIIEDDEQNFWMSCYNNGIYWYNPRMKKWSMFRHTAGDPDSLCGNQITGLFKDSKGNVWIHTEGKGICRYDHATQRFTSYTTEDGLPNDVIEKVLEDNSGKYGYPPTTAYHALTRRMNASRTIHSLEAHYQTNSCTNPA